MSRRTATAALLAVALLGTPAAAFADGAGDQQYQDPLAAPTTPTKKKQTNTTTTPSTPAPSTPAPSGSAAPATSTGTTASQAPVTPSSSSQQLPRTGVPADLIALGGVALIASGAVVRRRITQ